MLGPPTALYNSDGEFIVGRPSSLEDIKSIRVPVTVDGKLAGELRTAPRRYFSSPQETAFSRQQWMTSGLIGFVAMVLAVMVSLLLTRVLLAPIRRTIVGISRLSNGDYSTRLNEQRTDELGQLMGDLDRLAHKLEENRASRQRWLADISHELRTPMTVLTGEIESLKDGIRPFDLNQVHSLDQEITRLRRFIDDLYELSVSDIGGLRYNFAPVDIWQNVTAAVDTIRMRADEKGIQLKVVGEGGSQVSADSQRLDQLFINLLENALAYTDSPGRIEITLSRREGDVAIKIQDTPPGIDEFDCEKLFEPLYRHEISRSRRTAGVGLGLAICRNIVDAHQGTITASPSDLGGLCIDLLFPIISEK
jgi:two-component system sensor histidine kinase BaeS